MPTTLRCPACSAPLNFPGHHETAARCPYCGVASLLSDRQQGTHAATNDPQADAIGEIVERLRAGNRIGAVKLYRERFGGGLKEAVEAVDRIAAGQPAGSVPPAAKAGPGCVILPIVVVLVAGLLMWRSSRGADEATSSAAQPVATAPAAEAAEAAPAFASEVLRFGSEGTGAGRFTDARSVAVDGAGRTYVAEYQGGRVQVFDSTGTFVTQWMADPEMPLLDLAADRTGTVYVVQSGRIERYNGGTGDPLGELPRPDRWTSYSDVALALDGTVWAVEGQGRVVQLGRNGAVRRAIDVREAVKDASPGRVAVAGTGDVYVLDRTSGEVYRFGADGRFVDRFGGRGDGRGSMESPAEIAIDGRGRVFVSDLGAGIHVFDARGHFLDAFGGREVVFGLAFNDRDELFAALRNRHQVASFRLNR